MKLLCQLLSRIRDILFMVLAPWRTRTHLPFRHLCALPPTASAHEPKFELGHVSRGALALIVIYSVETPPVQRMTFLFNVRKGELS